MGTRRQGALRIYVVEGRRLLARFSRSLLTDRGLEGIGTCSRCCVGRVVTRQVSLTGVSGEWTRVVVQSAADGLLS